MFLRTVRTGVSRQERTNYILGDGISRPREARTQPEQPARRAYSLFSKSSAFYLQLHICNVSCQEMTTVTAILVSAFVSLSQRELFSTVLNR
jgi:hypothetical protein